MSAPKKVILAYSGGLDTSIILKWLQTEYGCTPALTTASRCDNNGHNANGTHVGRVIDSRKLNHQLYTKLESKRT